MAYNSGAGSAPVVPVGMIFYEKASCCHIWTCPGLTAFLQIRHSSPMALVLLGETGDSNLHSLREFNGKVLAEDLWNCLPCLIYSLKNYKHVSARVTGVKLQQNSSCLCPHCISAS